MAIIESASRDALFVITILRLIPRNKWISTTEIKQALESINVSLLDHVIIGKYDYASLKSMQVI